MAAPPASQRRRSGRPPRSSRSKREDILTTAIDLFGQQGYEYSKWADIAEAVGVGSTALYHYFESKLHCLYEIQALAVQADREKFERVVAEHEDFAEALRAVLNAAFELTDHEVMRNRVLVSEQSLAGLHRTSAREEEARQLARSQMRDLEFAWTTFLTRGMEQGAIPQADPRLLSRAILGLYNSVWHWYRPRGSLTLEQVREFFVGRCLAVAGLPEAPPVAAAAAPSPSASRPSARRAERKALKRGAGHRRLERGSAALSLVQAEQHGRRAADDVAIDKAVRVDPGGRHERRERRAVLACLAEHQLDRAVRRLGQHMVRPGRRRALREVAVELRAVRRRSPPPRPARWRTRSRTAGRPPAARGSVRASGPSISSYIRRSRPAHRAQAVTWARSRISFTTSRLTTFSDGVRGNCVEDLDRLGPRVLGHALGVEELLQLGERRRGLARRGR